MAINKKAMKDIAILAIAVTVIQMLLSKLVYPLLGKTTQQVFGITPYTAIGSQTFGDKILGYLTGILPFDLGSWTAWISIFIGAFLVLIGGYWIYGWKIAWKGKNVYQRLWAILLYGTAVLYVVILVTKWGTAATIAVPLIIGLGINYLILAFVVSSLAKRIQVLRV